MLDFRFLHPFKVENSGKIERVKVSISGNRRVLERWGAFHKRHRLRNFHGGSGRGARTRDDARPADRSARDGIGKGGDDGRDECHCSKMSR